MDNGIKAGMIEITAADGQIISCSCWENVDRPVAILQIFHGMAEHAGRYDRLAKYLNSNGIVVFADDHRGHGKTAKLNGRPGVIGKNGFYNIVEDEYMLTEILKDKYPNIPVYVLAHSFGSFVGQEYITRYGGSIDGIILSGSAAQTGPEIRFAKHLAALLCKTSGEEKEARIIEKLSFGTYNKRIKNPGTGFDWLSRDAAEVQKYIDDELCGFTCSSGFYYYFMDAMLKLYKPDKFGRIPVGLPVLLLAGREDPVGQYGRKVEELHELLKQSGQKDLKIKLYEDARHEILNELNRDEVSLDILNWLNMHINSVK